MGEVVIRLILNPNMNANYILPKNTDGNVNALKINVNFPKWPSSLVRVNQQLASSKVRGQIQQIIGEGGIARTRYRDP